MRGSNMHKAEHDLKDIMYPPMAHIIDWALPEEIKSS